MRKKLKIIVNPPTMNINESVQELKKLSIDSYESYIFFNNIKKLKNIS